MKRAALMLFVCASQAAAAQDAGAPAKPTRDFSTYQPTVAPTRIDKADAPKIDGDLSDPIWAQVTVVDEFYRVEPSIGEPSEPTRVYLAYDDDNLYVAIHAFDSEPDEIRTTILERDGEVWRDDMLRFYIDTFDTGISGFGFDVNALGARADRLVQANRAPVNEWDVIWDAAGRIVDDGWTSEFVIPFQSINFDPDAEAWGLMMTRELTHKNEEIRWAGIDQSVNKFGFERPGRVVGVTDVDQGIGLDVELSGGLRVSRDWERPRDDDLSLEPSATINYKFTPSLTGLLTFNSDFSDTPLDTRQVNTGRFSLFFPETRDFFLQDAAFFEFGGETFAQAPNGRPFFSRRIGIVNGEEVDLHAGAKISGEYGGVKLGALTAQMGEGTNIDSQQLSVARATTNVSENTRIGFIATHGDPTGNADNTVAGLDFLFNPPSVFGGGQLQLDAYYLRTFSSDVDDDDSYGVRIGYPNDAWNWSLEARHIGENYNPALGFVNRPGTREYEGGWRRRLRQSSGALRFWEFGTSHEFITDLDGDLETRETTLEFGVQNLSTDYLQAFIFENFEDIDTPFLLPRDILVPVGEYQNDGVRVQLETSRNRAYAGIFEISYRDYFGGDNLLLSAEMNLRPSYRTTFNIGYTREDISVPNGDVTVQIGSLESILTFSTDLSVSTEVQYDNISESFALFGRLNWEIRPETEFFISLGHGAIIDTDEFPRNFESVQTQAVIRLGNTYRF